MKINPINRIIIYEGISIELFNKIKDKLEDQNIEYESRINDQYTDYPISVGEEIGASRAEKKDFSKVYIIYIRKEDRAKAEDILMENER